MKKIALLSLIFIIAFLSKMYSCNCNGIITVDDLERRLELPEIVFTGKIIKIEKDTSKYENLKVTYEVKQQFAIADSLIKKIIVIEYWQLTDCSVLPGYFKLNQEYLVSAYAAKGYSYSGNNCNALIPIENAGKFIDYLEKKDSLLHIEYWGNKTDHYAIVPEAICKKWGFEIWPTWGCEASKEEQEKIIKHNIEFNEAMKLKHGSDWKERFKKENGKNMDLLFMME